MVENSGSQRRVVILSSDNAAAAQLASGLLRAAAGERYVILDAATEPTTADPRAARVLREAGIAQTGWAPQFPAAFPGERLDYAITVCATGCDT